MPVCPLHTMVAPQNLLELGLWHSLRRLSAQLEPGFWAHPLRPAADTPDFLHWRASLWRPEHPTACGPGNRARLKGGSAV